MTYDEIADITWDYVYQRANEEGDVDVEYDYPIIEAWFNEYFAEICREEGLDPNESEYYSSER